MAAAKIKRLRSKQTEQSEFHVRTRRVLNELLEPEEVQVGDRWAFVNGEQGLVIVRYREVVTDFPSDDPEEEEIIP